MKPDTRGPTVDPLRDLIDCFAALLDWEADGTRIRFSPGDLVTAGVDCDLLARWLATLTGLKGEARRKSRCGPSDSTFIGPGLKDPTAEHPCHK